MTNKDAEVEMGFVDGDRFVVRGDARFLFVEGYLSPGQILEWEKEGKLKAHFDSNGTKFFLAEEIEKVVEQLEERLTEEQIYSDLRELCNEETNEVERIEARVAWRDVGNGDFDACLEYALNLLREQGHDPDSFTLDQPSCDWQKPERLQEEPLDNAWTFLFKRVATSPMPVATRLEFPDGTATLVAGERKFPVVVHQDYEALDKAMINAGYEIDDSLAGWIATTPFEMIQAQTRILNEKLEDVVRSGRVFNVGFNQTGHFSIGYTIYARPAEYLCLSCGAALDGEGDDCIFCEK